MSVIDNMKKKIETTGGNKKEILYLKADSKVRIRFLEEMTDGHEFEMFNNYNAGIAALVTNPNQSIEIDGEACQKYTLYAYSVWDYENSAVKILFYKATGITPLPQFIEFYETYGTVMDRDYIIKKVGKGPSGDITIVPADKTPFKNKKAKAYTQKELVKILSSAYPMPAGSDDSEDDEEEEEAPKKKTKAKAEAPAKKSKKPADDEDDDEEEEAPKKKSKKEEPKKKKKEVTLQEKMEELELAELREIALAVGVEKKELKGLDGEEIVELLFDEYDEEDIQDAFDDLGEEEEDE